MVSNYVYNNFNNYFFSSNVQSDCKTANITPIFKKKNRGNIVNYCLVSVLLNLSKVYGRWMYIQIYEYIKEIFSE